MEDPATDLNVLDHHVASLARATGPSETFRVLLEGCRVAAPRVLIFLVRSGRLKGWSCRGYAADVASRLQSLSLEAGDVWLGRALGNGAPEILQRASGENLPDFGQPRAEEAHALPLRVGGKTVAVLVAERSSGEAPCLPAALRLLVTVARLRLELDLAWRRVRGKKPAVSSAGPPAGPEARPATPEPAPEPRAAETATSLEPVADETEEEPVRSEARTFARLVATDIRLYNEEAVMLGRHHRDLARRLGNQLERGKETFLRRFPDLGDQGLILLREAYVQVLAAGDGSLLPPTNPGQPSS